MCNAGHREIGSEAGKPSEEQRERKRAAWHRWYNSLSEEEKAIQRAKNRERAIKSRWANIERSRKREQAYKEANREKVAENQRRWKLKRKYGLTPDAYRALLEAQSGKCAVCKVNDVAHVDHDHSTGLVRGLLCRECNIGLGNFRDSISFLLSAAQYLEQHNAVA